VSFSSVQSEFNNSNREVQIEALARVNQYLVDFNAATVVKPTQEEGERLLKVCNYFKEHVKPAPNNIQLKNQQNHSV